MLKLCSVWRVLHIAIFTPHPHTWVLQNPSVHDRIQHILCLTVVLYRVNPRHIAILSFDLKKKKEERNKKVSLKVS